MMDREFNVHYAAKIKKAFPDLLINTVGSIMSIDRAEYILAQGWADFVSMCRPLLADRKCHENTPRVARRAPSLSALPVLRRPAHGQGHHLRR
jgi:2,4-dienoyl-CoA reductase-like NADH-dependent reductase (Old Yellow Enzyme family)